MKSTISWKFSPVKTQERKKGWYIWTTIIFLFLIIYSISTANFLFGLIIIMAGIIMFLKHHKEHAEVEFSITQKGIEINNKSYNFEELKNFWIIYEPPVVKNLYLDFKTSFKPTISIPLEKTNPIEVRDLLKKHLEEDLEKESESTIETLERILKL